MARELDIVVLGLTITSSWGNGHATTYRALLRELAARGHRLCFLERNVPWYAAHRDLPHPDYCHVALYDDPADLKARFAQTIQRADFLLVGSYVPDGIDIGDWVLTHANAPVAFYDIDTPVTLARLVADDCEYLQRALIPRYDAYFSFTGGPTLRRLETEFGAKCAAPLYCSVDTASYYPDASEPRWELGYIGTFSPDRQPTVQSLLIEPAQQQPTACFVLAGPKYPAGITWPTNVQRIEHLPPADHGSFYNAQRFTLNVTRADMRRAGFSPSVRLFEAAACGCAIISDAWKGIDTFFTPGKEILLANRAADVLELLRDMPDDVRARIGAAARQRVLGAHTAAHRAQELEQQIFRLRREMPQPVEELR